MKYFITSVDLWKINEILLSSIFLLFLLTNQCIKNLDRWKVLLNSWPPLADCGISLSRVMRKLARTLGYLNKISWKRRGKRTAERRIAQMRKGKKTLGSRGLGNIYIQPSKRRCFILQYIVLCRLSIRVWWVFQHKLYP